MGNAVGDFMKGWLNTTYQYLKESGGGPTYPPVTLGRDVLPGGAYSSVEDYPISYGQLPLPFNPNATGIPASDNSRDERTVEIVKQNPTSNIISGAFEKMFGNNMKACMDNQNWGMNNPNAQQACSDCAKSGDLSSMILNPAQRNLLGIKPSSQENKSDVIRLSEDKESLTSQIGTGAETAKHWMAIVANAGNPIKQDPIDSKTPAGANFQAIGDTFKGIIPKMPEIPGANTGSIVMIGGALVLIVLVIAVIK